MSQPTWKLLGTLGDASPIDHGGILVFEDTTGVYDPEAVVIHPHDEDGGEPAERWNVFRFPLDRCTHVNGVLSDNPYHPECPAWFAAPEGRKADRPQDTTYLSRVAESAGCDVADLIGQLCSEDPMDRARAYEAIGDYHGFIELDHDPVTDLDRSEMEARYTVEA